PISASQVTVATGVYRYDSTAQVFTPDFSGTKADNEAWTAMQVTVNTTSPTYFGKVLGIGPFNVSATASGLHRPRDIAIVLDFSSSMQYSSETTSPTTGNVTGSLNPDQVFPRFGPWSMYPVDTGVSATPLSPMQRTTGYVDAGGETHACCNLTTSTSNGPPV